MCLRAFRAPNPILESEHIISPYLAIPSIGSSAKTAANIQADAMTSVDLEGVTRSPYFIGRTMAKYLKFKCTFTLCTNVRIVMQRSRLPDTVAQILIPLCTVRYCKVC